MADVKVEQEFRKTATIRAVQWFKNGDHPLDYAETEVGFENGDLRTFYGNERKANGWEGGVVRYYRRPDDNGERPCEKCSTRMHDHGWIDTLEGGHIVCPGDWIATGIKGEHWPIKPDVFAATYEPVAALATGRDDKPGEDDPWSDRVCALVDAAFETVSRNPSDHEQALAYRRAILAALRASTDERNAVIEECARLVEKRSEERFAEHGTREGDTNACYYQGAAAETYEALDEEDEAIAQAIRALKGASS